MKFENYLSLLKVSLALFLPCFLLLQGAKDEPLENYWPKLPQPADIDKVVVGIHTTKTRGVVAPELFLPEQPLIQDFEVFDRAKISRFSWIDGAMGKAGLELSRFRRQFVEEMGTITFFHGEERFVVTITNMGFYLGPNVNEFHRFHSWPLANLVNDVALSKGAGLSQVGFNRLAGTSLIAQQQFHAICNGDLDKERYKIYKNRPANVWNIFPEAGQWPTKQGKVPGAKNELD